LNQAYYCDTKDKLQEKYTFYETIRSMYKNLLPIKLVNTDGDTFCIKFDSEHNSHQSGTIINAGFQSVIDQLFTQKQELSAYFRVNNADYADADKSNIIESIESANRDAEGEDNEYAYDFNPQGGTYPHSTTWSNAAGGAEKYTNAAGGAEKYTNAAGGAEKYTNAAGGKQRTNDQFWGGGSSNIIELGDLLIQMADALISPLKRYQTPESQKKITYLENIKVRTANTLNELFKLTSLRDETPSAQNQIQKIKNDHSILTATPVPSLVPSPAPGPSPAEEPVPSLTQAPVPNPQCNDGSSSSLAIPIASGEQKWFKVKSTGKTFAVRVPSE
jgi:hypothetical protein